MNRDLIRDIGGLLEEGFETIAIICKTLTGARSLYEDLKTDIALQFVDPQDGYIEKGVLVIPSYGAKGLEFDCALIYAVDDRHCKSELDRRLLYIACTRALHRLNLYAVGRASRFII